MRTNNFSKSLLVAGLLTIIALCSLTLLPYNRASAAPPVSTGDGIKLIVPIPIEGGVQDTTPANPGAYVKIVYQWAIGLAALLAMGQLVLGGVQYVISAGMPAAKSSAEERMTGAVYGLILLLCIVILFTALNPNLLNIDLPSPSSVALQGSLPTNPVTDTAPFMTTERAYEAAQAEQRLTGDYLDAYNAMKEEIDQQISRSSSDLQELVGDVTGVPSDRINDTVSLAQVTEWVNNGSMKITSQKMGASDDFYEYAERAIDGWNAGNSAAGNGYRDAVVAAFNYALNHLDTPTNHDDIPRMLLMISTIQPASIKNLILEGQL